MFRSVLGGVLDLLSVLGHAVEASKGFVEQWCVEAGVAGS